MTLSPITDLTATLTARQEALATEHNTNQVILNRLALHDMLEQAGVPTGGIVTTVAWPEDADADGTYDLGLCAVRDAAARDGGGRSGTGSLPQGAVPAGRYDEATGHHGTDWDIFRTDPTNPESDLVVAKVHAWVESLVAEATRPAIAEVRERVVAVLERWDATVEPDTCLMEDVADVASQVYAAIPADRAHDANALTLGEAIARWEALGDHDFDAALDLASGIRYALGLIS